MTLKSYQLLAKLGAKSYRLAMISISRYLETTKVVKPRAGARQKFSELKAMFFM